MKQASNNSFSKGMIRDLPFINTPNDVYIDALNATIITSDGNEFILQNERGNEMIGTLPPGFVMIGVGAYNNIAYILSYNSSTDEGQIGTFPSPDYANTSTNPNGNEEGNITNTYRPFNNYTGTNPGLPANVGPFTSTGFNFSLDAPLEVEVQPSYDGTVNVVFTDSVNPIRILNSRFRQLPNNRFEIIDRTGNTDVNIYMESDFESTVNLIQRSTRVLDLNLQSVGSGGQLPCGNYKYFFRYSDQDGNLTDIIEESRPISIFMGNTPSTIRGGTANERSNKMVTFSLSNVDTNFDSIRVFVVYEGAGQDETPIGSSFQINTSFPINNRESFTISHTGFEATTQFDVNLLNVESSTFDTARSLAQIQGRLLVANLSEANSNSSLFQNVASQIRIEGTASQNFLMSWGFDAGNIENIFGASINGEGPLVGQTIPLGQASTATTNFRNNGYYNEQNIYNFLGYWDQEVYSFGIVFILNDGSESQVFPLEGTLTDDYTGIIDPNTGFNATTGHNNRGIYRFNGNLETAGNTTIGVRGVRFSFDNVDSTLFTQIQNQTIGYYFVRSERIPNVLSEGYVFTTVGHLNSFTRNLDDVPNVITEARSPSVLGHFEAASGGEDVYPLFSLFSPNGDRFLYANTSSQIAYFDPDLTTERANILANITFGNVFLDVTGNVTMIPGNLFDETLGNNRSVIHTSYSTSSISNNTDNFSVVEASGTFIPARTSSVLSNFNARVAMIAAENNFNQEFESYIGFSTQIANGFLNLTTPLVNTIRDRYFRLFNETSANNIESVRILGIGTDGAGEISRYTTESEFTDAALRTRVYSQSAPYNLANLILRYGDIQGNNYFAISKRFGWQTTLSNNNVVAFGGDCFKTVSMRRISMNPAIPGDERTTFLEEDPPQQDNTIGRRLAFLISLITSNNTNTNLRDEELFDATETALYGRERPFYPYSIRNEGVAFSTRIRAIRTGQFKLEESTNYNSGYNELGSDKVELPFPSSAPFQNSRFDTRIAYSNIFINNQFSNGYREFQGLNFRDYSRHLGEIVRIENVNDRLFMVQENGVSLIGVNDRTVVGGDTSGAVLIDQSTVLHPKPYYLSEFYGSRWQWSIKASTNYLYGVDVENSKIWRTEDRQLRIISDFSIESLIRDITPDFANAQPNILEIDVRTHFNKRKNDVIFTFYNRTQNRYISITYNEILQKWISLHSFIPYHSFSIQDNFYTLNSRITEAGNADNSSFWLHDSETAPYCNYYGDQFQFIYEYVIVENSTVQKMINNLKIISNNSVPIQIIYNNDNDSNVNQTIEQRTNSNILTANAYYKENHVYIEVTKNQEKRIRDKYTRVRIIYSGESHTFVQALINNFTYSYS